MVCFHKMECHCRIWDNKCLQKYSSGVLNIVLCVCFIHDFTVMFFANSCDINLPKFNALLKERTKIEEKIQQAEK